MRWTGSEYLWYIFGMRFVDYIKGRFNTQREAAQFFGVTPGLVSHWVNGRRKPSPKTAGEIVALTGGEVTFEHIYGEAKDAG